MDCPVCFPRNCKGRGVLHPSAFRQEEHGINYKDGVISAPIHAFLGEVPAHEWFLRISGTSWPATLSTAQVVHEELLPHQGRTNLPAYHL